MTSINPSAGLVETRIDPVPVRLTPRQEQFAVDVASGLKPVDSYLRNYRCSGSRETASIEAAKLARKRHVAVRIGGLRD